MSIWNYLKNFLKGNALSKSQLSSHVPFKYFEGEGVCDVCNSPVKRGEAYLVSNKVFYSSKEYKKYLLESPLTKLAGISRKNIKVVFTTNERTNKSGYSAVCPSCIYMSKKRNKKCQSIGK